MNGLSLYYRCVTVPLLIEFVTKAKGVISEVPNVQTYISPYSRPWNERVEDEDVAVEDLVNNISTRHAPKVEDDDDNDDEQPLNIRPPVNYSAVLLAVNTLQEYEEQNEQSDGVLLRHLRVYEKEISIK